MSDDSDPVARDASFRPRHRIRDGARFRQAFQARRAVSDPQLVLHALFNDLDHPRLGVSVPRKLARRAVSRNRLKRLIREAFRLSRPELPAGVDLIVVPRRTDLELGVLRSSLVSLARDAARRLVRRPEGSR